MFRREISNGTGQIITAGVVILLMLVVGIYLYWSKSSSKSEEDAEMRAIENMVAKFNADVDWRKKLEELDKTFVSDVQEALVKRDGRPALLYVKLGDVVTANNKSIVHFESREFLDPEFRFILECDAQQAKRISEHRDTHFEYAVIALISSVRRSPDKEEDLESFLAEGHCLDLMPIRYW